MDDNIFNQLNNFYHEKTFDKKWESGSGNGNKKLDEIQVFIKFLENEKTKIKNIEFLIRILNIKKMMLLSLEI